MFDSQTLKKFEFLSIASSRPFAGQTTGTRRNAKMGGGLEFADYRDYAFGEDLRNLDWNVYARFESLYIKRYQEEGDVPVYCFLDASRSMGATSDAPKFEYAKKVVANAQALAKALQDLGVRLQTDGTDNHLMLVDLRPFNITGKELEKKLDEEDKIESAYILEVSSPGLTRPLKKDKDFKRSIGKKVEIKLFTKYKGLKQLEAQLKSYSETDITVDLDGEDLVINRKDISMIRLAFE